MINNFQLAELPFVKLLDKENLPTTAGIYFAIDSNDQIWYIGQAQNIRNRWQNHHRYNQLKKIDERIPIKLKWYECENNKVLLNQLEQDFITNFSPVLNQTKVEAKKVHPAEISLRKTLVKISKYVVIYGYEEYSDIFALPTVFLHYNCYPRNTASILKRIFTANNKKNSSKWSSHRKSKKDSIWKTKCNGICIVVYPGYNVNSSIQNGESIQLAGISLINLSDEDFQQNVVQTNRSKSYYPNIQRYVEDPFPLLWSENLTINQFDAEIIKQANKKRTEPKTYKSTPRGLQVKVYCAIIGKGKFVFTTYQNAIEWFGGYEILGLTKIGYLESIYYKSAPKQFKPHKVIARIPEENGYRSISAPISASTEEELEERLKRIRQLSTLHQKVQVQWN